MAEKPIRQDIVFNAQFKGGRQIDRARKGILGLQKPTLVLSRRFGNLRLAALGATGAIAGISAIALGKFIKDSVSAFRGFEASMLRVKVLTGSTGLAFQQLSEFALQLSGRTIFTARETAEAMQVLAQAGFENAKIFKTLSPIMNFAAANQLEFAQASRIATDTLSQFNLEVGEINRVLDVLTITGAKSKTNVAELGQAFRVVGPVAASLNQSLEDTSAVLAILAEGGERGAQAGTKLRNIMLRLLKPVGAGQRALDRLGISVKTATGTLRSFGDILAELSSKLKRADDAAEIFGVRNTAAAAILLTQGVPAFQKFRDIIDDAAGTAERFAKVQLEGLDGAIKKLSASFEELQIRAARELGPELVNLVDQIRSFITRAETLDRAIELMFGLAKIVIRVRFALASVGDTIKIIGNTFEIVFRSIGVAFQATFLAIISTFETFVKLIALPFEGLIKSFRLLVLQIGQGINALIDKIPASILGAKRKAQLQADVSEIQDQLTGFATAALEGFQAPGKAVDEFGKKIADMTNKNIDNIKSLIDENVKLGSSLVDNFEKAEIAIVGLEIGLRDLFLGLNQSRKEAEALKDLKLAQAFAKGFLTLGEKLLDTAKKFGLIRDRGKEAFMAVEQAAKMTQDRIIELTKEIERFPTAVEISLGRAKLTLFDFAGAVGQGFAALAGPEAGALFAPIDQLRNVAFERLAVLQEVGDIERALKRNLAALELADLQGDIQREVKLTKQRNLLRLKSEKAKNSAIIGSTAALFGAVGQIIQTQGGANFKLLQGIAIGEAIVNTFLGASQALKEEDVPTALKFLNVAAIIATGLATVASIASAKPGGGGGGGGGIGGGGATAGGAAPTIPGELIPVSEQLEGRGPQITINVEGFIGDESELAAKLGEIIRQAVGDDVDFGLNTRL